MARQLSLFPPAKPWTLDRLTIERGRRGVARARAALAATNPDRDTHDRAAPVAQEA